MMMIFVHEWSRGDASFQQTMNPVTRLLLLFLLCISLPLRATCAADNGKPNVVYILCDDLGYGDVHCLNPQRGKIPPPQMDRLASQGVTFTDAHSSASVCTPTRYGILTGRYNWRSGLQSGVLDGYVEPLIATDRLTVPGLFKQNGYHTAIIGKWHLGFTIEGEGEKAGRKAKRDARRRQHGQERGRAARDDHARRTGDTRL